jgi:squalene-associated FAD-dependent desaturase
MSALRVAVVGGGLAGISAAVTAADAGAEVVLVERRSRLGGLTWSFQRNGLWFDNGQHVFLRCCTAYRSLLDRIGSSGSVHLQRRLDVPVLAPGRPAGRIRRTSSPAPFHLARALARYRHLGFAERIGAARAAFALRKVDPADPALDEVTFGAWLASHGQGARATEALWDLIALPTLNVHASEASLALAAKVFRTGLLDRADAGDIGWSLVPLGRLHADPAAQALQRAGVELVLGTRVESIGNGSKGVTVVTAERTLRADVVIVATPPDVTASITPVGCVPPVEGLGTSPIVNVHLVLDRTVTDLAMAAAIDSPVQFVFDRTTSSGLDGGQCLAISLSGADAYVGQRPEELVRLFFGALGDLFPAARRARLVDGVVTRERTATFRPRPGTHRLRPGARTSVPGVFLAGAWCDTGWPATMEGAVRSGTAAAYAVLDARGPTSTARAGRSSAAATHLATRASWSTRRHLQETSS